jgi:hypothetical protein
MLFIYSVLISLVVVSNAYKAPLFGRRAALVSRIESVPIEILGRDITGKGSIITTYLVYYCLM